MKMGTAHSGRAARRAFTLLEVTVAVVILAILAAMIVPRFSGTERRRFEAVVDQVADMLIVYAQRDRLTSKPVGIFHDLERHWLTIVLLEDPDTPGTDEYGWRVDPTVTPVKLPEEITEVFAYEDYELIDITQWPLTSRSDQRRPVVEMEIGTDTRSATLTLSSHAVTPKVTYSYATRRSTGDDRREPIDLDRGGRNREDW